MKKYINTKFNNVVETIDQVDRADFNSYTDFRKEVKRLVSEYSMAYNQYCYSSKKSDKNWSK